MSDNAAGPRWQIKSTLLEFIFSSTIHGLPRIVKAKYPFSKFIWAIFSCIALVSCSYLIYDKCSNYLEYQVITNSQKLTENSAEFPTVTICAKYAASAWRNKTCLFNAEPCDNFLRRKNSFCIAFNSGFVWGNSLTELLPIKILKSNKEGSLFGLRLVMTSNYISEVFKFWINNHAVELDATKALDIRLGHEINLSVKRTFLKKLSSPYSNCRSEVTLKLNSTVKSFPYFKSECFGTFCFYKIIATECNKSKEFEANIHLFYTDKYAYGVFADKLGKDCGAITVKIQNSWLDIGPEEICRERCPIQCSTSIYSLEPSYNIISSSDPKSAYINVYYENFDYTLIEEAPKMEAFDLFGYVGGYFGKYLENIT